MVESTTTRLINAPRSRIYNALVDGQALSKWLHPAGTNSKLHECVQKVGGHLRMEITHGPKPEDARLFDLIFVEMRPEEAVVFRGSFVSDDPAMASKMQITITLKEETGGTIITLRHEGIPVTYRLKTMSAVPNPPWITWRAL